MTSALTDTIRFLLDSTQAMVADWFLRALSQVVCVLGARGAGKSGLIRAIIFMVCISSRKQVLYASQSSGNSLDQFNKLIEDETLQKYLYEGNDKEAFTTKPIPTIRWKCGSETLFWSMGSMEDHVKRGLHPHVIIVDEAQSISETSWSRVLYPMRIRIGGGAKMLVFGSTPDTDGHWFWRLHQKGLDFPNDAGVKSFVMNTENALAFKGAAGKKVLAEARATMADHDYQSEFGLKPGGQGNHYFNPADIDACVAAYKGCDVSHGTLMALDPALGSHDPMAYVISDLRGNIFLSHSIDMDMSDTDQVQEVIDMAKKYQSLLVIEANSTAFMTYSGSMKLLLPYGCREIPLRSISTKAQEGKNSLCKQAAWMFEHRQISVNPECKTLVKQLKSLRDYKLPSGVLQIRAPDKDHDDEAFGAIILTEAVAKGWQPDLDVRGDPAMGLI
jgi:hypothetical protein